MTRFFAFVLIPNETNCMSQKAPLPSLTGHRLKTRKRDEKKQYDPTGFRDAILEGLEAAGDDLEAVSKFLDVSGSKLDYRRYGVNLIEILIAGGLLAPGGIISTEGENGEAKVRTNICLFGLADSMEKVKAFEQVFVKLMRRYKYLEKMHEEEMRKILVYLNGFTDEERLRLAEITAVWLATGQIPPSTLSVLINEHQVKDGMALKFFMDTLVTLKAEKGGNAVTTAIKRSGIESRLMEFFPPTGNQQTEENFIKTFKEKNLGEVVTFRKNYAAAESRSGVLEMIKECIDDEKTPKEIIIEVKDSCAKNNISEQDALVMIWTSVMSCVEWNKKEDLLQDQALRHLKQYTTLFGAFATTSKSEIVLLNKVQDYCYENMNFLKTFNKIVLLLYKTDVLSEDAVLKWYKEAHSTRGWSVFMDQMKKFVDWLEQADEESDEDDDEDED